MMLECLFVGLGGFIGSVARYLIGLLAVETASGFPVKTFCINLLGSFILGIVSESALRDPGISRNLVLFLQIGVCGGFTTFSTFSSEALKLFAGGADALTKNEHTVWNDPDGVLVFYSSAGCQRALMVFP